MANSTSKTDIINLALANLGQDIISSGEQETASARTANLMYDFVRRNLLRAHDWTFSLRHVELAQSAVTSPFKTMPFVFVQPTDCLFIKQILPDGIPNMQRPFFKLFTSEKNEKLIACEYEKATAVYVRDEDNASLFDPAFVSCFAFLLAAELAVPLCGDTNMAQLMMAKYASQLEMARQANKIEQQEKPEETSVFWEAR